MFVSHYETPLSGQRTNQRLWNHLVERVNAVNVLRRDQLVPRDVAKVARLPVPVVVGHLGSERTVRTIS